MKILVLTKRQYMAKDLIDDRFGRFRELPLELARLGHEVQGLALSYRWRPEGAFVDGVGSSGASVTWNSVSLLNGYLPQLRKYTRRALKLSQEFRPDIIWACSDAYQTIFGSWLAKRVRARCIIDLYDNFEAFAASRLPGVLPFFRRVVKTADGVTAFSGRLANHVTRNYTRTKLTTVVENGIRKDLFQPRDQKTCRDRLGLPINATIIGTAGALDSSRGIETLFEAFAILSREASDVHLALAGPRQRGLQIPTGPRVHDFKELPHEDVASLVNALDLAVVCYRHSSQGEVSFPQKAYEIIACRIPLVAAAVGSMNELLVNYPDCLYEPENPASLASAIRRQLRAKTVIEIPTPTWADSAKQLSDFFQQIMDGTAASAMQTPKYRAPR
jgi:teichuronic acid biosynthesis glycosyltransferase TuaC